MRPPLERQEAERLVETYSDLVLRLSYSYLNQTQDAQDICQTVFLKLLERAPDFVSSDHEKAWIIRTTANTCKDLLKSHWRRTTVAMEAASHIPAPELEEGSLPFLSQFFENFFARRPISTGPIVFSLECVFSNQDKGSDRHEAALGTPGGGAVGGNLL